ncbi:MAG: PTS fructose-like transporter subunit EIIB [Klebsiella michiganensis]|nr:PTS fructose-like transporter subunit EIIB [Klebsiella michiganensis]
MDFTIVAVTACVSGVAHTYMAAERLEKVGHQEKWNINVVLLVTDIEIDDAGRFSGIRTIKTSIKTFLLQPQQIVDAVKCIMKKPVVYLEIP